MNELSFYQRQMILKEVGESGQALLKNSKILIVGAGGLGHPVASYLAAAGVGEIFICDYDKVELSNLHRQVLFTPDDIGFFKADILAEKIRKQNPFINVNIINTKLNAENIKSYLNDIDLIVDCCDNFSTKFLLHDSAFLFKKDLVQASIYQFEGQLQTFPYKTSGTGIGCMRCLWPSIPSDDCSGSCALVGVFGATAGVLGSMQAMEVIKLICKISKPSINTTKTVNLINMEIDSIKWKKDKSCVLCGNNPKIIKIEMDEYYKKNIFEITKINLENYRYIDIREKDEYFLDEKPIIFEKKPFSEFENWKDQISKTEKTVFICQKGIKSMELVYIFNDLGYKNCFSLKGGFLDA